MTRVDFYVLPEGDGTANSAVMTTCKLCEKAMEQGHRIYVHVPDAATANNLDDALWSFRQGGFLSHERYTGAPLEEPYPSVLLGQTEPPPSHQSVLINLGPEVPLYFSRFERVLEIVAGDAAQRAPSRVRFKFYRDRGYELATHNLAATS